MTKDKDIEKPLPADEKQSSSRDASVERLVEQQSSESVEKTEIPIMSKAAEELMKKLIGEPNGFKPDKGGKKIIPKWGSGMCGHKNVDAGTNDKRDPPTGEGDAISCFSVRIPLSRFIELTEKEEKFHDLEHIFKKKKNLHAQRMFQLKKKLRSAKEQGGKKYVQNNY